MSYNGWSNRETWLANVYFSEQMTEYISELSAKYDFADEKESLDAMSHFESYFSSILDEQVEYYNLPTWLIDFIVVSEINWRELFLVYISDFISENEDSD